MASSGSARVAWFPSRAFSTSRRSSKKLESRSDPLIRRLTPPGRKRGAKYAHNLYPAGKEPALEEGDEDEEEERSEPTTPRSGASGLRSEVEALRAEIAELRARIEVLESQCEHG